MGLLITCLPATGKDKCHTYNKDILSFKGPVLCSTGLLNDKTPLYYLSSDYISIGRYKYIEYNLPCSSGAGMVFYDDKNHVVGGHYSIKGGFVFEAIPEKASSMRVSFRMDDGIPFLMKLHTEKNEATDVPSKLPVDEKIIINKNTVKTCCLDYFRDTTHIVIDYVRIPIIQTMKDGCIIVMCQAKITSNAGSGIYLVSALTKDHGSTWTHRIVKQGYNPNLIYDSFSSRLFLFSMTEYFVSEDFGNTWNGPMKSGIGTPMGWNSLCQSPTTGIQLKNGVLATAYELFRTKDSAIINNCNVIVYSTDFGNSWAMSIPTPEDIIANEVTIAEIPNGKIMLNSRGGTEMAWGSVNPGRRVFVTNKLSFMRDGFKIQEFEKHISDRKLKEPICNASFITFDMSGKTIGLFSNPNVTDNPRRNLTLKATRNFRNWKEIGLLTDYNQHIYGYSGLSYLNGHLYFVYDSTDDEIIFSDISNSLQIVNKKLKL